MTQERRENAEKRRSPFSEEREKWKGVSTEQENLFLSTLFFLSLSPPPPFVKVSLSLSLSLSVERREREEKEGGGRKCRTIKNVTRDGKLDVLREGGRETARRLKLQRLVESKKGVVTATT